MYTIENMYTQENHTRKNNSNNFNHTEAYNFLFPTGISVNPTAKVNICLGHLRQFFALCSVIVHLHFKPSSAMR